jgi:hypothetical protein
MAIVCTPLKQTLWFDMQDAASGILMHGVVDRMAFESSNAIPDAMS